MKFADTNFASLLNLVSCVPVCQRGQHTKKLRVSVIYVPTCLQWNVPINVPIFQTFLFRDARENFYTLLLYKKFYIVLDITVIHIICICIAHKNCFVFHVDTSYHIKEKCVEFFFFIILFFFAL